MISCIVLGGGGHAAVLLDAMAAAGQHAYGVLDNDPKLWGQHILGVLVLGPDGMISDVRAAGVSHFVVGVGSVGDSSARERLYRFGLDHGLELMSVIHPTAFCSPYALLGRGVQVLAGAIVNARARIGDNVIVNTGAIIEHNCDIGRHAHIATRAALASTVSVGEAAHVGAGAVVRQCIKIGARAIIGIGAAVVTDVEPGAVVIGVPARRRSPPTA